MLTPEQIAFIQSHVDDRTVLEISRMFENKFQRPLSRQGARHYLNKIVRKRAITSEIRKIRLTKLLLLLNDKTTYNNVVSYRARIISVTEALELTN